MAKRTTPEDDVERLSERVWRDAGGTIRDKATFDSAFDSYMDGDLNPKQDKQLRNRTFDKVISNHPSVSRRSIHADARGKDFERDRKTTAKRVVTSKRDYKKFGASNVDLQAYDTRRGEVAKVTRRKKVFNFNLAGKVKKKVVFARKTSVFIKFKKKGRTKVIRFRDRRGRFVRVKKR